LTRVLDLASAESAEVRFQAWYHIEEDWDYAYVVVGTTASGKLPDDLADPDVDWEILRDPGLACTVDDPNSSNLGCGLTGRTAGWVELHADLSRFAGQQVALRFEYVTDGAVNQPGFAIDDIQVTVDGSLVFADDAETPDPDWIAEGFVRHANVVPQGWLLQLVTFGDETTVTRLLADTESSGSWTIDLDNRTSRAVLAVSALAPVTTEPASYEYSLTTAP
jgi:bacillopeptidase F (M6 metalloprotease family)